MPLRFLSTRLALGLLATTAFTAPIAGRAASTGLNAVEVNLSQFVIVAAPIPGSGTSQLQIYEQVGSERACYAINGNTIDPLLVSFDFTNICQRYIDSNNYSLRIGSRDLGTIYRLSIRRSGSEHVLMAIPTKPGAGPELRVARASGDGESFLRLELESGWSLRRRNWQGTNLEHLYVYRDSWPRPADATIASPAETTPAPNQISTAPQGPQPIPVQPASGTATGSTPAPGTSMPLF